MVKKNQKISVLHLISSADFLGAERVVCELALGADKNRYQVLVGILGSPDSVVNSFKTALDGSNIELIYFPCPGKFSTSCLHRIQKKLVNSEIKIVHSHGYKSDLYGYIASRFVRSRIHLIATNHTWKLRTSMESIYKFIDKTLLKSFEAIIAVSDEVRGEMVRLGIDTDRLSIINNGVSTDGYDPLHRGAVRQGFNVEDDELIIGCVASLTIEKAHAELIHAFSILKSKVPRAKLILVGDGPEYLNLSALAESLGIKDEIIFTGQRQDVKNLYTAFDVFALVSHFEGLPMAMLEAMAASLPVVVSAVGAIPHVIQPMVNGILIPPGDINSISDSLMKLAGDSVLRETLGKNARNEVVANYSVHRMASDYERLYGNILGNIA
jgi:glycosyltransferase involved in cell wall biosynthesis